MSYKTAVRLNRMLQLRELPAYIAGSPDEWTVLVSAAHNTFNEVRTEEGAAMLFLVALMIDEKRKK